MTLEWECKGFAMELKEQTRINSSTELFHQKSLEIDDIKKFYLTDIKDEKLKNKILLELEILAKESIELKNNMAVELCQNDVKIIQDFEKLKKEYLEYFNRSNFSGYPTQKLQNEYMRRSEQLWDKRRKDDELTYQTYNNKFDESVNVCLNKIKNTIENFQKQEKRITKSNQIQTKTKTKQKSNNSNDYGMGMLGMLK